MRPEWQHAPLQILYQNDGLGGGMCVINFSGILSYHDDVNCKKIIYLFMYFFILLSLFIC